MGTPTPPPETIAEDDLCPICQLLLSSPVKTTCAHIMCRTCLSRWASISQPLNLRSSSLDLDLTPFDPTFDPAHDIEANCPMCRTATTATADSQRAGALAAKYPDAYAERRVEEELASGTRREDSMESVVILIGNRHKMVEPRPESGNKHDWTFFVRLSRPDIVSHVRVNLHPSFRPPRVILGDPPFEVRRLGWGYFAVEAVVVLKEGYEWIGGVGERDEVGERKKRELGLEWMLDFEGEGRQGRVRAGVRKVDGGSDRDWGSESPVRDASPLREPSPVREGSPMRDVSPVRWPHMDDGEESFS